MAGVGVEVGLQRNTHHDENHPLKRNFPQTHRKNLAHDTLVSTVARGKDVCERWRWSVRQLLTNNLGNGRTKNDGFPVITKPIHDDDGNFLGEPHQPDPIGIYRISAELVGEGVWDSEHESSVCPADPRSGGQVQHGSHDSSVSGLP